MKLRPIVELRRQHQRAQKTIYNFGRQFFLQLYSLGIYLIGPLSGQVSYAAFLAPPLESLISSKNFTRETYKMRLTIAPCCAFSGADDLRFLNLYLRSSFVV